MLKKNYNSLWQQTFFLLPALWKPNFLFKNPQRLITPLLFWTYMQPLFFLYLFSTKFFFFKFFNVKRFRKVRFIKLSNLSKKDNFIRSKKQRKINKMVSWFTNCKISLRNLKKKRRWPFFTKKLYRWQYQSLKRFRKYRMRKNFMRCIKQRLELSQNMTGKLLFNVSKKTSLKKLFQIFRNSHNNKLMYLFFFKHFFFATFYKKFIRKYAKVLCVTNMLTSNNWSISHINLINLFFFRKKKINKLFPFTGKKYFFRYYHKGFSKKKRYLRRKIYRRSRKNFVNYYRSIRRFYIKVNVTHKELLSCLVFNNNIHAHFYNYYLNYIINIWNIRSYNWKQIT